MPETDSAKVSAGWPYLDALLPALKRLDGLLERAVAAAENAYGQKAGSDPYRGLYISREEVGRLFALEPGVPTLQTQEEGPWEPLPDSPPDASRLSWFQENFGLSHFDVDVMLIALAPELDLRYERLYAYLQDDVTRKRPSVDLALNLLCDSADEKLQRRAHFAPTAPLIRDGLILLVQDPHQVQPPLLSHYLKLDEQIVGYLLGQGNLDARLVPFCRLASPTTSFDEVGLNKEQKVALRKLAARSRSKQQPLRLYLRGNNDVEKDRTAEALARSLRTQLLRVDLNQAAALGTDLRTTFPLLFREARFLDALLYFQGVDKLREDQPGLYTELMNDAAGDKGITLFAGIGSGQPFPPGLTNTFEVHFLIGDFRQHVFCWRRELDKQGITLDERDIEGIASRFRLRSDQIASAVAGARSRAMWRKAMEVRNSARSSPRNHPSLSDLYAAARMQCGHTLDALAKRIEPLYTWNDIVLPSDALNLLKEICQRAIHRQRVFGDWGFDHKLSLGKGANVLFSGPSGTGKTMAAEIVAHELGLDLYKIDLSTVVSKWIGETEKNLDRIFTAAENSNAILFFDEADALFGKRSEVRDSHDRYANLEISFLLQKMEEYEGVAILATNMRAHLDDAFLRRLAFIVHFPFPDEQSRKRIWTSIWPHDVPLGEDLDFDYLARQFKTSGGVVKNIALAAAFLAAEEGSVISMKHLLQATHREFLKLGKNLEEIGPGSVSQGVRMPVGQRV